MTLGTGTLGGTNVRAWKPVRRQGSFFAPWAKQSAGPSARRANPGRFTVFRALAASSDSHACTPTWDKSAYTLAFERVLLL